MLQSNASMVQYVSVIVQYVSVDGTVRWYSTWSVMVQFVSVDSRES